MKITAAFFVAISLVLMAACGSDDGGSIGQNKPSGLGEIPTEQPDTDGSFNLFYPGGVVMTEYGAHHAAIDLTLAIDPTERELAYYAVAKAIAEFKSYLPTPNRNVVWEGRGLFDDSASFLIIGIFPHEEGEGQQFAVFDIERTQQGTWIPEDEPEFDFTRDELGHRRDLEKIEEYQAALALFDDINPTLLSDEAFVDYSTTPAKLIRRFSVQLENATGTSYEVGYTVEWDEVSADPRCEGPEKKSDKELVGALSTISIEVVESKWIGLGFGGKCQDVTLANSRVSVTSVGDYRRDYVEQQLETLLSKTSP